MKFISDLSPETINMLKRIYKQSKHHKVRQRAHCILLSFQGYSFVQLMKIFEVSRKTMHNWIKAWSEKKLVGLYDEAGRGRKQIFNSQQKEEIRSWAKESPKNLKNILGKIDKEWRIKVSKDTIKRVLKSFLMSWRRLKKGVGGEPDPEDYQQKKQELERLKKLDILGEIDLRYFDETGFCLVPYVPDAWQEKGATITLKSRQGQRLNLLRLMNKRNEFYPDIFEGKITRQVVITYLDKFSETLTQKTVIVMDNASIHRSASLVEKCASWQEKNLEIFWLPTYSPHLNLIETLWRFIKYQWLDVNAYQNWISLVNAVEQILKEFGTKYVINFA
ncbi:IS630 family transposase [Chroococcus sp. FPU101]|uniref:IS630 family transposase n=1 Tax=Chroococcus sp. FPU101 TaxID=1974212 RepID=UPI001A8FBEBC|nr:IS630 family transposase [Chroococcus sp. FPU101]GFE72226.1 conserved hypothetical protein [Chroococcus sp. FPU101]